jgi:hypothetical protein
MVLGSADWQHQPQGSQIQLSHDTSLPNNLLITFSLF